MKLPPFPVYHEISITIHHQNVPTSPTALCFPEVSKSSVWIRQTLNKVTIGEKLCHYFGSLRDSGAYARRPHRNAIFIDDKVTIKLLPELATTTVAFKLLPRLQLTRRT